VLGYLRDATTGLWVAGTRRHRCHAFAIERVFLLRRAQRRTEYQETQMDIEAERGRFAEALDGPRSAVTGSRQSTHQREAGRELASESNRGAAAVLGPFVRQHTVLLTTYRRNGTPVGTPVHIAVEGDCAFVRTWDETWKLKRIRHTPEVEVAPSTLRGVPTGPAIHARARILDGDEAVAAGWALARKYPVMHGVLVPLVHRLRGNTTMHVELTPVEDTADPANSSIPG